MKLLLKYATACLPLLLLVIAPSTTFAAAGIFGSGGGTHTVGESFTVTVTASGDSFDSLQGAISVSGPVTVVAFSPGSATWLPGKTPANNTAFVGITTATTSLTVARITLRGTAAGSGAVSVSGTKLARNGAIVGTAGSGSSFTIQRALVVPGAVQVSSSSHPDPSKAYEATTADLTWKQDGGVTGFSYVFDQAADTSPALRPTGSETKASFPNLAVGTYYFHIRAQNGDGWGPASHFKLTIKEPDPKINPALSKPKISSIAKTKDFTTNLEEGTATGVTLSGKAEPNFTVNFTAVPAFPEGTPLTAPVDSKGDWHLTLATPLRSGFYSVTIQGQKDKVLTPVSDPAKFEISLAKAGNISFITLADAVPKATPTPSSTPTPTPEAKRSFLSLKLNTPTWLALAGILGLIIVGMIATMRHKKPDPTIL